MIFDEYMDKGKSDAQVEAEVESVILQIYKEHPEYIPEVYEEVGKFARKLQDKYPEEHQRCRLWHKCFGSSKYKQSYSGSSEKGYFLDFEEEDSVYGFVMGLAKKYLEPPKDLDPPG